MNRATLSFVVPVEDTHPDTGEARTRWLTAAGALTADKAAAARFTFYRSPRPRDTHQIESLAQQDYSGGLSKYLDLVQGIENARAAVQKQIEDALWPADKFPDGRPKVTGKAALEQAQLIEAAWKEWDTFEARGWRTMRTMHDRLDFCARWAVLGVGLPPGWESLMDREIDDLHFYAVWAAWNDAHRAAATGNGEPSKS